MENNNPAQGAKNTSTPNPGVTPLSPSEQSRATPNVGADTKKTKLSINCSIRRRPSLIGLPGTDPNARIYKIGASIDSRTRKNLKGVDGIVESKFMPSIIGTNVNDNSFQEKINEYWGNIGVLIPADEDFLKEEVRGKIIKIDLTVTGAALATKVEAETDIEKKVNMIKEGIEGDLITIAYDHVPDFILLCYALKYSKVAKDFTLLDRSPKIHFYIYNKSASVKAKLTTIQLRNKAITEFAKLAENEEKVNQLLVIFNKLPNEYDTFDDKLIELDSVYNLNIANMQKFVDAMEDTDLALKYLITYAVKKGKLHNPPNTDAYYYNQVMLGGSMYDAVLYLKNEDNTDARLIKETLIKEIKD